MKKHNCNTCGETDPDNFYATQKSICKKCTILRSKANRPSPAVRPATNPPLCKTCGETDPDNFYHYRPRVCKKCIAERVATQPRNSTHPKTKKSPKPHHCRECGEQDPINFYPHNKGKCKKCCSAYGIKRVQSLSEEERVQLGEDVVQWQDDNVLRYRWLSAKSRAVKKNIEFNISDQYVKELWEKQDKRCYYTGLPMMPKRDRKNAGPASQSVSIDRLDSTIGYVAGNVVLCRADVNVMKGNMSMTEFKELITILATRLEQF